MHSFGSYLFMEAVRAVEFMRSSYSPSSFAQFFIGDQTYIICITLKQNSIGGLKLGKPTMGKKTWTLEELLLVELKTHLSS